MNATAPGADEYAPATVNLPFICDAEKISHITLHKNYECTGVSEKLLFLEVCGITGNACVYCNGEKLISHTGAQTDFRVQLSSSLSEGDRFILRIEINPRPRTDNKVIIGKINLIQAGEFRFDDEKGSKICSSVSGAEASLRFSPALTNPTNYDIVTTTVKGPDGAFLCVRSCKASASEMNIPLQSEQIYSASNPALINLDVSLLRDTMLLDSISITTGVCSDEISDGAFRRNSRPVFMSGVSLADFSSVKKDIALMKTPGFNTLQIGGLTAKSDIFSLLDAEGIIGWYNLPYSGRKSDLASLRELINAYYLHPSFVFAVCDGDADDDYIDEFTKTVGECPGQVIPALRYDLLSEKPLPASCPQVILLTLYCRGEASDVSALEKKFDGICDAVSEGTVFALDVIPPEAGGIGGLSEYECCRRQREIYTAFSKKKNIIGYFAGDIRSGSINSGLFGSRGASLACKMFRAVFSRGEYLKIETDEKPHTSDKNCSVTVFSNNPSFKVLVNSKPPKHFNVEEKTRGIYEIKNLKLTGRENLIEISAGEQCDNITVIRG